MLLKNALKTFFFLKSLINCIPAVCTLQPNIPDQTDTVFVKLTFSRLVHLFLLRTTDQREVFGVNLTTGIQGF